MAPSQGFGVIRRQNQGSGSRRAAARGLATSRRPRAPVWGRFRRPGTSDARRLPQALADLTPITRDAKSLPVNELAQGLVLELIEVPSPAIVFRTLRAHVTLLDGRWAWEQTCRPPAHVLDGRAVPMARFSRPSTFKVRSTGCPCAVEGEPEVLIAIGRLPRSRSRSQWDLAPPPELDAIRVISSAIAQS